MNCFYSDRLFEHPFSIGLRSFSALKVQLHLQLASLCRRCGRRARFFFDENDWKPITTPHAWNEDNVLRVNIDNLTIGIATCRKNSKFPSSATEKKVFQSSWSIKESDMVASFT